MASPTKPLAPIDPLANAETDMEFEAAVERVGRRNLTPPRKGFDDERQGEENARAPGEDDEEGNADDQHPPGGWTLFSDD